MRTLATTGLRPRLAEGSEFTGVFLNDHFMGHVGEYDNSLQGQLMKAGEYQLKVVSPEGQPIHKEKIGIKDNRTTVV
jgi:hypothetical protein